MGSEGRLVLLPVDHLRCPFSALQGDALGSQAAYNTFRAEFAPLHPEPLQVFQQEPAYQ